MSIVSSTQMWSRRAGQIASPDGRSYSAQFPTAYQVLHAPNTSEAAILNSVPALRSRLAGYDYVFCTSVGPIQAVGPIMSIVPVVFSGEIGGENSTSPFDQPPQITYESATSVEAIDIDGFGLALTNSNGEPVQGLQTEVHDMILSVSRPFLAFNGVLALQYMNSVNSDFYQILGDVWAPGQCAMKRFRVNPIFSDGGLVEYFQIEAVIECRLPYNTVPARAHWHRYRNEGFYERLGVAVAFTGGGGAGAAGYAITSSGGAVTKVVLTARGRGYTSAPTVTITGGSGATATAAINSQGEVASVSVGAGGTGYRSRLVRAVDDNKEPLTRPVLLAADGTRLRDSESAVFIERPKKQFALPYTALGLL